MSNLKFSTGGKGPSRVMLSKAKILAIEDISNKKVEYLGKTYEIGVSLTIDIGKENFKPTYTVAGNFKRDVAGKVIGWGSAFVLRDFFSRLGFDGELNTDHTIPAEALTYVVGKEFLRLSYLSGIKGDGRPKFSDWAQIGALGEDMDLLKRFEASVATGYPKNYHPELSTQVKSSNDLEFPPVESKEEELLT